MGLLKRSHWRVDVAFALAAIAWAPLGLASVKKKEDAPPIPARRFAVEPLGFVPPGKLYQPYRVPFVTLDFLDATHLLFTFHIAALMERLPNDPPDDEDQTVRAVVFSLPAGKIVARTDWRLHDRGPYLWTLDKGRFLLRKRDTLYIGDDGLNLKPYLSPDGKLASVQISPDKSILTAQYASPIPASELGDGTATHAPTLGPDAPRLSARPQQYSMLIVNTAERQAKRVSGMHNAVVLPMVQGGYLGVDQEKAKLWNIAIIPFSGQARQVASVTSSCQPTVQAISEKVFLAQSCIPFTSQHLMDAFSVDGKKLWEQVWQSRFTWGTFAYSAVGNRFVYGSVEVDHDVAALDPIDSTQILGQPIGVFDVATGDPDLVVDANPVLTAGRNFALSPGGDKLAVLRNGAVEIYDLQAASGKQAPPK